MSCRLSTSFIFILFGSFTPIKTPKSPPILVISHAATTSISWSIKANLLISLLVVPVGPKINNLMTSFIN